MNRVLGQACLAITLADVVRQGGTERAVGVDDVGFNPALQPSLERQLGFRNQLIVKSSMKLMVLLADIVRRHTRSDGMSGSEDEGQVDVFRLRRSKVVSHTKQFGMTDHFIDGPNAKLGHDGAKLVGNVVKEVDDVLRRALELLSKDWILGGDADGAGVELEARQQEHRRED
jgi:hypothetical protein